MVAVVLYSKLTCHRNPYLQESQLIMVDPVEVFVYGDEYWSVYYSDEGHLYYLTMHDQDVHSQWGDPRIYGRYHSTS